MRYSQIKHNDIVDGEGVVVSLWMQGCPIHCEGCHNSSIWDENGGIEKDINDVLAELEESLTKNGIKRNFSILGGEPLAPYNVTTTNVIGNYIRQKFPDIKIYLWTGYTLEELYAKDDEYYNQYTNCTGWADVIIDGPWVKDLADKRLKLRGSSNQRILYKGVDY